MSQPQVLSWTDWVHSHFLDRAVRWVTLFVAVSSLVVADMVTNVGRGLNARLFVQAVIRCSEEWH